MRVCVDKSQQGRLVGVPLIFSLSHHLVATNSQKGANRG